MGQRLNIEIMSGDEVLANSYYHWSAYTGSALHLTKKIIVAVDSIIGKTKLEKAVRVLELTGAGVGAIERERINNDFASRFANIEFRDCTDRNAGLLAVTEEGIGETRRWEEGRVTIHLDSRTFDFGVFWDMDSELYEEEYEESAKDVPLVDDFDFYDIPFERLHELIGLVETYDDGIRFSDGTIVKWIA